MLTDVLNYLPDVWTKRVSRWTDSTNRDQSNDRWNGIWESEAKMLTALSAVEWLPGSTVPTPADVIAAKVPYEVWVAERVANAPKREMEDQLRSDPKFITEVALQARNENKTINKIIEETLAKI